MYRGTCRLVVLVALLAAAHVAVAAESARDLIHPRLTRQDFGRFVGHLELDRSQEMIVEMQFADYTTEIGELMAEADRAADDAGRRKVTSALEGRSRVPGDQLREMRVAVLQVYQGYWGRADDLLGELIESIVLSLYDEQRPRAEPALRELRRALWLRPRREGESFQEYAGDGVDIVALAEAAGEGEGEGELAGIEPAALRRVLDDYAARLDALLLETAEAHRAGVVRQRIARIGRNAGAQEREERAALERWERLYGFNRAAADAIAALMSDETARQRWLDRVHRASYPWLYRPARPDRQHEWLAKRSLGEESRQRVEKIYGNYAGRRRALLESAVKLMLQARLEYRRIVHPGMDPAGLDSRTLGIYEALLQNSGERSMLEEQSGHLIEAVLPDDVRADLRRAMRR